MSAKKIRGISLLELMLSLAVIAILLVMATRYFTSVSDSQRVDETVKMVQTVTGAADNWLSTYKSFDKGGSAGISMPELINQGLVPDSFNKNPWGGDFSIQNQSPSVANIIIYGIPSQADCANLQAIFCNKQNIESECVADTGGARLNLSYPKACAAQPTKP